MLVDCTADAFHWRAPIRRDSKAISPPPAPWTTLKPPETTRDRFGQVAVALNDRPWIVGAIAVPCRVISFPSPGRCFFAVAGATARTAIIPRAAIAIAAC